MSQISWEAMNKKVLITCPPMIAAIGEFKDLLGKYNFEIDCPEISQTLSENMLVKILPKYDGWIIGDDLVTEKVLQAGLNGKLKAAIKWGVGTDNIDFSACKKLNFPIENTPNVFGAEVADLAVAYLLCLSRDLVRIDREVREGKWPKYPGISLSGKRVGIIGYGDIGKNIAKRLKAFEMKILFYDPFEKDDNEEMISKHEWPESIDQCDFIILACSLNSSTSYILNKKIFKLCKDGVKIINISRGGLINEMDLIDAMKTMKVSSAALDVFEKEPLSMDSYLRQDPSCVLGSHNASNTIEAVKRVSEKAIIALNEKLER